MCVQKKKIKKENKKEFYILMWEKIKKNKNRKYQEKNNKNPSNYHNI